MASSNGLFIGCLVFLVFCNIITYLLGINPAFNSLSGLISTVISSFVSLGLIAIGITFISFFGSGATGGTGWVVKWVLEVAFITFLMFAYTFQFLTFSWQFGLGLASNMANLFSSDINAPTFIGYLMFNFIGIVGLVGGIISTSEGS